MGEMAEDFFDQMFRQQLKLEKEIEEEKKRKHAEYLKDVCDKIWTTKDGTRIPIKDMNTMHLKNARRLIILNNWRTEFLSSIEWEINKRELLKEVQAICAG